MIFVSSACSRRQWIREAVAELAGHGFRNIELSGGTGYYDDLEYDLLRLRDRHGLNYLIHNYFPPPKSDFVINLASPDRRLRERSLAHLIGTIDLCRRLGIDRYGIHAGFLVDPDLSMLGGQISGQKIADREDCFQRFVTALRQLVRHGGDEVRVYVENNVCSRTNRDCFGGDVPLMGLRFREMEEIRGATGCGILCDVAHLFVTSCSLGLDFPCELAQFMATADYLHVSDNDGLEDQNRELHEEGIIFSQLKGYPLRDRIITLEIYEGYDALQHSLDLLSGLTAR